MRKRGVGAVFEELKHRTDLCGALQGRRRAARRMEARSLLPSAERGKGPCLYRARTGRLGEEIDHTQN